MTDAGSRTYRHASALEPKPLMATPPRLRPKREISAATFNHLISPRKQRCRYRDPERLSSLQVDHQLIFGRGLHRQIGGLLAFDDAINVAGRAAVPVGEVGTIRDQVPGGGKEAFEIDGW